MPWYYPAWGFGGPARMMYDYAIMAVSKFEVAVLTGGLSHDFSHIKKKRENIDGVIINRYRVFSTELSRKNINLISPALLFKAVKLILSTKKHVVIHVGELRGSIPFYAQLLKILFKNKVVLVHSAFGMLHYKRSFIRHLYDFFFMKSFLKLIDTGLAQNRHEIDEYLKFFSRYKVDGESKILLFPLHIENKYIETKRKSEPRKIPGIVRNLREKYNIPQDLLVFIFLGRLHPAKGILRMIDAFLEYSSQAKRGSVLLIVGRDDGFQVDIENYIVQKKADRKIKIINNVYENRWDYYYMADIFLGFPTIYEETMLASIEAMSCGTPVIVSKEADIPFVEEGGAGFVINYGLMTAVKCIIKIVSNLECFQEKAFHVVDKKFNRKIITPAFLDFLEKSCEGSF